MRDTWYSRDLPVLLAIAERLDRDPGAEIFCNQVQAEDLTDDDADRAFDALVQGGYVIADPLHDASSRHWLINGLTEKGRRASGLWPDAEALADRLLALLEERIDAEDDPDTRNRLQKALDGLKGVRREVLVNLAASLGAGAILG